MFGTIGMVMEGANCKDQRQMPRRVCSDVKGTRNRGERRVLTHLCRNTPPC